MSKVLYRTPSKDYKYQMDKHSDGGSIDCRSRDSDLEATLVDDSKSGFWKQGLAFSWDSGSSKQHNQQQQSVSSSFFSKLFGRSKKSSDTKFSCDSDKLDDFQIGTLVKCLVADFTVVAKGRFSKSIVFLIECQNEAGSVWTTKRSRKEFEKLYRSFSDLYDPTLIANTGLKFPLSSGNHFWITAGQRRRNSVLEDRMNKLSNFLQKILSSDVLRESNAFQTFVKPVPKDTSNKDSLGSCHTTNSTSKHSFSGKSLSSNWSFNWGWFSSTSSTSRTASPSEADSLGSRSCSSPNEWLGLGGKSYSMVTNKKETIEQKKSISMDDYQMMKVIGRGSFGIVILVRHKEDGKFYAIKAISKEIIHQQDKLRYVMCERNVLFLNNDHPFLVGLQACFQTAKKLYFVLDYAPGGELFFHLHREGRFSENRTRFYVAEMVLAIEFLHANNIIYRDLKPENILLDAEGHVMLSDFGLSKENIDAFGKTSTFCGTPEYLASEQILKRPYDRSVDWYCLGAVMYEMLMGLPPFYSKNHQEMYMNILNKPLTFPKPLTPKAQDLITKLLSRSPEDRLGFGPKDATHIKAHPYFEGIDWSMLAERGYRPPFKPTLSGPTDLSNFDCQFTKMSIPRSMLESKSASPVPQNSSLCMGTSFHSKDIFDGFTYDPNPEDYDDVYSICSDETSQCSTSDEGDEPRFTNR